MSNKAIDQDGHEYYADRFTGNFDAIYFCPNDKCRCKLKLKNIGADEKSTRITNPYFSAIRGQTKHVEGCIYKSLSSSFSQLSTDGFSADNFFHKLLGNSISYSRNATANNHSGSASHQSNAITTVYKLWHYCVQHSDEHVLPDGKQVWQIYHEKRNTGIPNAKRSADRIALLGFINCNYKEDKYKNTFNIWCWMPHDAKSKPPGKHYILGFDQSNKVLLNYFCEKLEPMFSQKGYAYIVAGGTWENNFCKIKNKRQIHILR